MNAIVIPDYEQPIQVSIGLSQVEAGSFWGKVIDDATGGLGFCHAFLMFHRLDRVWEAHSDFGVRFRNRGLASSEILIPLPDVTVDDMWAMLQVACDLAGDDYDYNGVVAFKVPFIKETPGDEFCSEGVVMVGQRGKGMFSTSSAPTVSPNGLAVLMRAAGLFDFSPLIPGGV